MSALSLFPYESLLSLALPQRYKRLTVISLISVSSSHDSYEANENKTEDVESSKNFPGPVASKC